VTVFPNLLAGLFVPFAAPDPRVGQRGEKALPGHVDPTRLWHTHDLPYRLTRGFNPVL
jgi:hypothetical protein